MYSFFLFKYFAISTRIVKLNQRSNIWAYVKRMFSEMCQNAFLIQLLITAKGIVWKHRAGPCAYTSYTWTDTSLSARLQGKEDIDTNLIASWSNVKTSVLLWFICSEFPGMQEFFQSLRECEVLRQNFLVQQSNVSISPPLSFPSPSRRIKKHKKSRACVQKAQWQARVIQRE